MKVELRFYKRYDADLLSLHDTGASLSSLTKAAVVAYANGKRARYMIPKCKRFNFEVRKTVRLHMTIEDPRTVELLSHIKNSYRNQFCKTVLRDALVTQCIGTYISSTYDLNADNGRLQEMMEDLPKDTIILNEKKKRVTIHEILKGNDHVKTSKESPEKRKDIEKIKEKIIKSAKPPMAESRYKTEDAKANTTKSNLAHEDVKDIVHELLSGGIDDEPDVPRFTSFNPTPEGKGKDENETNTEDFMNMFESITNL